MAVTKELLRNCMLAAVAVTKVNQEKTMATVNLLRKGEVVAVEVPTSLHSDDDCRVFLSYYSNQRVPVWDASYVKPLVDAYNSGTVSMDTLITMANSEIISTEDVEWPVTEVELLEHIATFGLELTR